MAYKAFEENEINGRPFVEEQTISISEDSPCASHLHLFTGIRSLGKLDAFKVDTLPSFDEIDKKHISQLANPSYENLMKVAIDSSDAIIYMQSPRFSKRKIRIGSSIDLFYRKK